MFINFPLINLNSANIYNENYSGFKKYFLLNFFPHHFARVMFQEKVKENDTKVKILWRTRVRREHNCFPVSFEYCLAALKMCKSFSSMKRIWL